MTQPYRLSAPDVHALSMVFDFALDSALDASSQTGAPRQRLHFSQAQGIEIAWQPEEVLPALQRIEQAVQQGAWATGYIAYEAAAGLDPALAQAMRQPPGDSACDDRACDDNTRNSNPSGSETSPQMPPQTPLLALALFAGPDVSARNDGADASELSGTDSAAPTATAASMHGNPVSNSPTPAHPLFAGGLPMAHLCLVRQGHVTASDSSNTYPPTPASSVDANLHADAVATPITASLSTPPHWQLNEAQAPYVATVNRLRQAIAAGDLYQVNYTLRADATVTADFSPWRYYEALRQRQQCRYGAFLNFGNHHILSLSPELFFDWDCRSGTITTRPMKGTAPRGTTPEADAAQAASLRNSAKERAENVMIVDLLRNDLGRIAQTGSVHVPQLLHTEPYPTLWQMTSTVQATTRPDTTFTQVLQALFPCGSITGAPKRMAMQKIAASEATPRGVYCGAVGFFHKDRALFNVAIRTITHTPAPNGFGHLRCGTGGGITWPAQAEAEYAEAQLKLRFLHTAPFPQPDFALRETLLLADGRFALLPLHLQRLAQSTRACSFAPIGQSQVLRTLKTVAAQHPQGLWRVALTQTVDGQLNVECSPLNGDLLPPGTDWAEHDALPSAWLQAPTAAAPSLPVALAPAANHVDACWLLHKTTQRAHYEAALAAAQATTPDVWDVILHTPDGFATECTRGNLVLQTPQGCITPPLAQGLLPGTLREALLRRGMLREKAIPIQRLQHPQPGDRLWFINSVRSWLPIRLLAHGCSSKH